MFALMNVYTQYPLKLRVQYQEKILDLDISTLISKRNKAELDEINQFVLLNAYLDYKGDTFKSHLFDRMSHLANFIINNVATAELPIITNEICDLLNMFDLNDIYKFITTVFRLQPLTIFKDTFDMQLEKDDILTRDQTYVKQDYFELASLTLPLKVALGILGSYSYVFNKRLPKVKELLLYRFIKPYAEQSPATQKLKGYIERISEQQAAPKDDKVRIIEKFIPEDETGTYILGALLITKLSIGVIITDTNEKNMVNKLYNFVINKRKIKQDSTERINDRVALTDRDTGEKESIVESYRVVSKLSPGSVVELDWSVSDIYLIAKQLDPKISKSFIDSTSTMKHKLKTLINNDYKIIVELLGIIFKNIIDPRSIEYLSLDSLINLIRVGFCYLWINDHKFLAVLVGSITTGNDNYDELVRVTSSVARTRLSKEYIEELEIYFPHHRVINPTKTISLVVEWVTNYIVKIESKQWIPICGDKYVEEVMGNLVANVELPKDIKNLLAKFLIANEQVLYNK